MFKLTLRSNREIFRLQNITDSTPPQNAPHLPYEVHSPETEQTPPHLPPRPLEKLTSVSSLVPPIASMPPIASPVLRVLPSSKVPMPIHPQPRPLEKLTSVSRPLPPIAPMPPIASPVRQVPSSSKLPMPSHPRPRPLKKVTSVSHPLPPIPKPPVVGNEIPLRKTSKTSIPVAKKKQALPQKNSAVTQTCRLIPRGLRNVGSTCYALSTLQVLFHLSPFRQAVMSRQLQAKNGFASVLRSIFIAMNDPHEQRIFDPERLRGCVQKWGLKLSVHQDAAEFLGLVCAHLAQEVPSFDSHGMTIFREMKCELCGTARIEAANSWWLQLKNIMAFTCLDASMHEAMDALFITGPCCELANVEHQFSEPPDSLLFGIERAGISGYEEEDILQEQKVCKTGKLNGFQFFIRKYCSFYKTEICNIRDTIKER